MKIHREVLLAIIVAVAITLTIGLSLGFWDWLRGATGDAPPSNVESPSTTVRNIVLGLAAVLALAVAVWRGWVANRQATISDQARQDERYQNSAAMLGSSLTAVRLGGIYQLRQIAYENPRQYHLPVMDLLCAFIRTPPEPVGTPGAGGKGLFSHVPVDLEAALDAFAERRQDVRRKPIEKAANFNLDLSNAELPGANLMAMDFSGVSFADADLTGAVLNGSDLTSSYMLNASLINAELLDVVLRGADLGFTLLSGADFSNANFADTLLDFAEFSSDGESPATGLTQAQIDIARAEMGQEPILQGVLDADTGQPLVWNSNPTC